MTSRIVRDGFLFGAALFLFTATFGLADDKKPEDKKADDKPWTQLFNGKDLTGWKMHPKDEAQWEVKEGILIGSGIRGHLFSERDDYENFRYRVEARINDNGNSGLFIRTIFAPAFPPGYEVQINSTNKDPIKTGSLYPRFRAFLSPEILDKIIIKEKLTKPNEWFTQEVLADGNHIVIKVNGKTTVDFVDEKNTFTKGHFAIQQHDPKSVIELRKIEVLELPATKK